ncbi:DNA topoisomerase I, partial [Actinomyces sp. S6-Spd3]
NRGLSAGRVQSVATRLMVDRERERMAHVAANYWDIEAEFEAESKFTARVSQVDGLRVAQGRDFGDDGQLKKPLEVLHLNEGAAKALADVLSGLGAGGAKVLSVEQKPYKRRPAAPFTTSTLQQEAGRKLRWNSRDTMRTAQSLYENGYITYMRTDSTALSKEAISAARAQAREMFGADSVPSSARVYAK